MPGDFILHVIQHLWPPKVRTIDLMLDCSCALVCQCMLQGCLSHGAQVFGKTLLCKDLDKANEAAHRTHMNCVTMGGDEVSKKGSFTGGFRDLSRSEAYMSAVPQLVSVKLDSRAYI